MTRAINLNTLCTFSLTTSDSRWLHASAWEHCETVFQASSFHQYDHGLAKRPPFRRAKNQTPIQTSSWVLAPLASLDHPCAWATLTKFPRALNIGHLFLAQQNARTTWSDDKLPSLSLLISAVMLTADCDLLMISGSANLATTLDEQNWGEASSIYEIDPTFVFRPGAKQPLVESKKISIYDHTWWAQPQAKQNRKTLDYLVKRQERRDSQERWRQEKVRFGARGFWRRLMGR